MTLSNNGNIVTVKIGPLASLTCTFLGKLGTFHCTRPISSWRLLLPLTFLLIPLSIALSRTADYHHHWQDVLAGSMLGFSIIWMIYRQVDHFFFSNY